LGVGHRVWWWPAYLKIKIVKCQQRLKEVFDQQH
jgi:hypothetical protein